MKHLSNKFLWAVTILVLLAVNVLSFYFFSRIDLTNEKRFTISEPVKTLLRNTEDPVEIYVFLKGDLPAGFRMLSQNARELLDEFKSYAHGKINYKWVSPEENVPGTSVTWADTLGSLNIVPINLTVQLKAGEKSQYIYPAAAAMSGGKLLAINLFPGARPVVTPDELNKAESMFEYDFAHALLRLRETTKPLVAYATGNGEPTGANTFDLVENVLKPDYDVFTLDLNQEKIIPDTFKLLILVKPTVTFTEEEKLKIDQYVMRGGKLLFFIDRLQAEMDSLQIKNQVIAYDRNLNLEDLLFKYGVRINPDLLMDLQSDYLPFDVNNNGQFELLHWNYFPLLNPNPNNIITKNVGLVAGRFVNSMDTVKAERIRKTILLNSSPNSRTIETPALISGAENRNAPEDGAFNRSGIPAAVLLEGRFTSLFKNRISPEMMDSLQQEGTPFMSENLQENKMVIVSDGDIVLNNIYKNQPLPMGVNPFTIGTQFEYQFSNHLFVANCVSYLIDEGGLIQAKRKEFKLRMMDSKKVDNQKLSWQLTNFAAPVFLIILFGLIYQLLRRKKFRNIG